MAAPRGQRADQRPGARASVVDEGPGADGIMCTCCEPPNPLVMRPDFGTLGDGSAEYALCVLHEPHPVVYRNRGDGTYLPAPHLSLNAAGEIVDDAGNVVARVLGDSFQRLTTVDDEDDAPGPGPGGADPAPARGPGGAARPAPYHVDLSEDDFYDGPR